MATKLVPKTQLRDRIRAELAALGEDTLVVTDRGKPVAVMVGVERWNALQERIETFEDLVAVLEHRASGDAGRPLEDILEELDSRHAPGPADAVG